nr:hypothetical protein [Tanacetum cinerariifolium]
MHAVKRIFRYLKGHPTLGLWYPKDSPLELIAYSDSDYTCASLDKKSTTKGCQFLGSRLISWQCKKQTITKIHMDNESAIYVVKNPVYHLKTKHIEIRHHFKRDSYEKRLIEMVKIHTANVADLLTKAFDVTRVSSDSGVPFFVFYHICSHFDGKAVVISESLVRSDLLFDDEDDEAVNQKEGDRGIDTGGRPRRQETIGGTSAQTRSERVLEQPNEPPLTEGHTSRSEEGRLEENIELTDTVPTPHDLPLTGETELSNTKAVYNKAFITLTNSVKKLESQLKQKRSKAVIHSSDEEGPSMHIEDSPKQGRIIEEMDKDENINLVSEQGEVQETDEHSRGDDDETLAETPLNIKRRQKSYAEELVKEEARQEQERYNLEKALELQRQLDQRKETVRNGDQAKENDWNDPQVLRYHALHNRPFSKAKVRKNMIMYLKNQRGYKQSYFKGMKYEDIKPLFERIWDQVHTFVPKDSEIERKVMKRAGFDLQQESSKKQRLDQQTKETEEEAEAQGDSDQKVKELKIYMRIIPEEDIAIKAIPLAIKPAMIIEYKIVNEGIISTYHITRADRSTRRYTSMINLLKNINREDLETLWKLVKDKYGNTRPRRRARPNRRLRPDGFEAKAEWWVRSREFFDGRIHEAPPIPTPVKLPSRSVVPKYVDLRYNELINSIKGCDRTGLKPSRSRIAVRSFTWPKGPQLIPGTPYIVTPMSQQGFPLWSSTNQAGPSQNHDVGVVNPDEMPRGKRETFPRKKQLSPFTCMPTTTVAPKKRANNIRNKTRNDKVSAFNLGKVVRKQYVDCMSFLRSPEPVFLDYDIKGFVIEEQFWRDLVPYVCKGGNYTENNYNCFAWLSDGHINCWMELMTRDRPPGARYTVAKTRTSAILDKSNKFMIWTNFHLMGMLDGSSRPYPSWDDVDIFRIQQYLQNKHYALWEVIEFGDSYQAPPEETGKGLASESSAKKKGRTVAITTADIHKRRNDVKARTTLLLALPDEHQLRFSKLQAIVSHLEFMDVDIEQDDLNQKFLTSLALEWLMYTIVWRNIDELDTMSLDDVYNHLKVFEPEVQKKSDTNSQNMAFISSSNTSSGKGKVHTASVPIASTQVSTASTDVASASISYDTVCAFIASQSNGSQIKYEDITQIDEDGIKEIDIQWNMDLLSMRADRWNASIATKWAILLGREKATDKSYMANEEENHALVADKEVPTEFALMAKSSSSSKNKVYDDSFCGKNTKNLNTKITKLNEELSDGLPEFVDDTVTDYSRPSHSIDSSTSNTSDLQNSNSSVFEHGEPSDSIMSKPMIKFVKAADCPKVVKTNKTETARKSPIKYAEMYRSTSKSPKVRDEPASPLRDDSQGKAFPTVTSLDVGQDRENIIKTSALPHESSPRVTSLDADEGSGVAAVSVSPVAAATTVGVPTASGLVPTVSAIFNTASVVTPYSRRPKEISTKDKGMEKVVESDVPKKKKLQEQIDAQVAREMKEEFAIDEEYEQAVADLTIREKIELINELTSEDVSKEDPKGMMQLVHMKEKIIRLRGHPAVYQFFVDMLKQFDREDLHQLWALVKETLSIRHATKDKEKELWVELKRLFEPDFED